MHSSLIPSSSVRIRRAVGLRAVVLRDACLRAYYKRRRSGRDEPNCRLRPVFADAAAVAVSVGFAFSAHLAFVVLLAFLPRLRLVLPFSFHLLRISTKNGVTIWNE